MYLADDSVVIALKTGDIVMSRRHMASEGCTHVVWYISKLSKNLISVRRSI